VKLFNAIAIFDVYVVAETSEEARKTLLAAIAEGQAPSEIVGAEINRENSIRSSWLEQSPFVGGDVSEQNYTKIKGKTTIEIYRQLYTKTGK